MAFRLQINRQMDISTVLAELYQELEQIDEAILCLERLARAQKRPRGRPPRWLTEEKPKLPVPRKAARSRKQPSPASSS
jgi:hypothetical protein